MLQISLLNRSERWKEDGGREKNGKHCLLLTNDKLFERSKSESSSCSKVKSLLVGCVSQQVTVFVHTDIHIA